MSQVKNNFHSGMVPAYRMARSAKRIDSSKMNTFVQGWFRLMSQPGKLCVNYVQHHLHFNTLTSSQIEEQFAPCSRCSDPAEHKKTLMGRISHFFMPQSRWRQLSLCDVLRITQKALSWWMKEKKGKVKNLDVNRQSKATEELTRELKGVMNALHRITKNTLDRHRKGVTGFLRAVISTWANWQEDKEFSTVREALPALAKPAFPEIGGCESVVFGKQLIDECQQFLENLICETHIDSMCPQNEEKEAFRKKILAMDEEAFRAYRRDAARSMHSDRGGDGEDFKAIWPAINAYKRDRAKIKKWQEELAKQSAAGLKGYVFLEPAFKVAMGALISWYLWRESRPFLDAGIQTYGNVLFTLGAGVGAAIYFFAWEGTNKRYSPSLQRFSKYVLAPLAGLAAAAWVYQIHRKVGFRNLTWVAY